MSIRTTVTLDDDVVERIKRESRTRGLSFRETLNELLRLALVTQASQPKRGDFQIKAVHAGYRPGLNHDSIEALLEYGEGDSHR